MDGQQIQDPREKVKALTKTLIHCFLAQDDLPTDPLEGMAQEEGKPGLRCTEPATMEVEAYTVGVTSTSPGIDTTTARLLKACWDFLGPVV